MTWWFIMKYITSSFSNNMFQEKKDMLLREQISEEQFRYEIQDAYSCVAAEDIALHLGVALNKETVKARPGDIVYNVTCEYKEYKYYRIQVMPSTLPCNKEYCEELI